MATQNLNETFRELVNPEYNKVPVSFCKRCLSLNIKVQDGEEDFCDDCGSTNILTTNIFEWERLYMEMYEKPFLKIKNRRIINGRN